MGGKGRQFLERWGYMDGEAKSFGIEKFKMYLVASNNFFEASCDDAQGKAHQAGLQ